MRESRLQSARPLARRRNAVNPKLVQVTAALLLTAAVGPGLLHAQEPQAGNDAQDAGPDSAQAPAPPEEPAPDAGTAPATTEASPEANTEAAAPEPTPPPPPAATPAPLETPAPQTPATTLPPPALEERPSAGVDAETSLLSARGNVDWINALRGVLYPSDNPPRMLGGQTELRPNLRLEYGSTLQAIAQLRFGVEASSAYDRSAWQRLNRSFVAKIAQLYAMWRFNDNLALAFGYQDFQWGPAELITPSNRMFRVLTLLRDPLFLVYGRGLVRVNLSIGRGLSAVVLTEVIPNGEAAFVSGETFQRNGLVKVEYSADDGSAYIGVTAGAQETMRGWFGEYAAWSITDNFSVYADASHTPGSRAWYPVHNGAGGMPSFEQTLAESRRLRTMAIFGARYTFTSGIDIRCEYNLNDAGYTNADMELAATIARAIPMHPELAGPYSHPGYEILARRLVYASLRIPDLPPSERLTLQARYLFSITDGSGAAVLGLTINIQDSYTVFITAVATHGPYYGEFSRAALGYVLLGLTVSI